VDDRDITKYSFEKLKKLLDNFPTKEKLKNQEQNNKM
jgi:hypothetical protein